MKLISVRIHFSAPSPQHGQSWIRRESHLFRSPAIKTNVLYFGNLLTIDCTTQHRSKDTDRCEDDDDSDVVDLPNDPVSTTPLPCPFCGGPPVTEKARFLWAVDYWIECQVCGCKGPACDSNRPDYAIRVWNTRHP